MRERAEATVTDITAGRLQRVSKVIVHPLTVRITHWLNALAMFIMIIRSDFSVLFSGRAHAGGQLRRLGGPSQRGWACRRLAMAFCRHVAAHHQRHRLPRLRNSLRAFSAGVLPRRPGGGRSRRRQIIRLNNQVRRTHSRPYQLSDCWLVHAATPAARSPMITTTDRCWPRGVPRRGEFHVHMDSRSVAAVAVALRRELCRG